MVQFQHGVCCLPADVFHSILAHSVLPRSIMCGLFDPPDATKDPYMGFIANEIIFISEDEADVETMAWAAPAGKTRFVLAMVSHARGTS